MQVKNHQKDDYSLNDSIFDSLLYYSDRLHSTAKVAPYMSMMNAGDKELMKKIKTTTLKRKLKRCDSIWNLSWWHLCKNI